MGRILCFHHKFLTWLEINGYNTDEVKAYDEEQLKEVVAKSPYYKATSNDVDWLSKVHMQGEVQKWVDHSISVTINLPEEAKEELVSELYVSAWKSGCKGVTVYRDGSRTGVLVSNDSKKNDASADEESHSLVRPKVLDAEIIRFNNDDEKWIAFVGIKDDRPYEIFTGLADEEMFPIPKSIKKERLSRHRTRMVYRVMTFSIPINLDIKTHWADFRICSTKNTGTMPN